MVKKPIVLEFRKVLMIDEDKQDVHAIGDKIEEYLGDIEYTGYYINTDLEEIAESLEQWE